MRQINRDTQFTDEETEAQRVKWPLHGQGEQSAQASLMPWPTLGPNTAGLLQVPHNPSTTLRSSRGDNSHTFVGLGWDPRMGGRSLQCPQTELGTQSPNDPLKGFHKLSEPHDRPLLLPFSFLVPSKVAGSGGQGQATLTPISPFFPLPKARYKEERQERPGGATPLSWKGNTEEVDVGARETLQVAHPGPS